MSQIQEKYEKKQRRLRLNGMFYAALSSASFGFSPLFSIALLSLGLSNFDVLSYRWLVAGIVLMVYAFCRKKTLRLDSFNEVWKIVLLSSLRAITSVTLLIGYANIASGVASTINFMYPVIVAACMMLFFNEDKSPINIGAIFMSILGVYLLSSGEGLKIEGGNTGLGLACSLISALSFAAYYILMKRLKADKIEVVKFTTWVMMLCAVYFIVGAFIADGRLTVINNTESWLYIAGLGLWSTMVSNFTGVKAVRRIGPTLTSIFGALQPLTAVVLGVCYLDEHLGVKTIAGIVLIMIAVSIVVTHHKSKAI
jgi:drug/metabolite transporter (DMT)-like permease